MNVLNAMRCILLAAAMAALFMIGCGHDHSGKDADPHAGHDHAAETADEHAGHDHASEEPGEHTDPETAAVETDPHAGHDHSAEEETTQEDDPHAGHDHEAEASQDDSTIDLDARTAQVIGLQVSPVIRTNIDVTLKATGKVINDQDSEVQLSVLVPGRVNMVMADWGETVKKGQKLVCFESIELGQKQADYDKAKAEHELALKDYNRKERLFKQEAVSEKQLLESEAVKKAAEINLEYAKRMLMLTGVSKDLIDNPFDEHSTMTGCSYDLVSPIDGIITERNAIRGEQIEPGARIFTILDLSHVWIEADIYEKDLRYVRKGGKINATVPAFPEKVFGGKITYISGTVDELTRTIKMRSMVHNHDHSLKPGMFADVDFVLGSKENVLAVPVEALMNEDGHYFVFTKHGEHYHRNELEIGTIGGGMAEVLSGLNEGQEVVVRGQYQLKSKMLMSGVDPHAGHNHD